MACQKNPREILSLVAFRRVHLNSKRSMLVPWQDKYSKLKTTCHVKPKFPCENNPLSVSVAQHSKSINWFLYEGNTGT